jgi:GTP-binding protein
MMQVRYDIAAIRSRSRVSEWKPVFEYATRLTKEAEIAFAINQMCKMKHPGLATTLMEARKVKLSSAATRDLALTHAVCCDVKAALHHVDSVPPAFGAQLLVEVLAVAINAVVETEQRRQENYNKDVEVIYSQTAGTINVWENDRVSAAIEDVRSSLPRLFDFRQHLQAETDFQTDSRGRVGLQVAFDQLLAACGRVSAIPESFIVLEWMEALGVSKTISTYNNIGLNVIRSAGSLAKVWDLPMMPDEGPPEVVFAGRSNVGKSSLVNMLLGQEALAPTSSKPGKTKTIDFYSVNEDAANLPQFRLVDVPGLGFAKVSKDLRQRWIGLIGGYFSERRTLKIVFHLLDAGLGEILPADVDLWQLLAQANREDFELCICLTKADNSTPEQMEKFAQRVAGMLRSQNSPITANATIYACSSMSMLGKDTLWRKIYSLVEKGEITEELSAIKPQSVAEFRVWEEFQTDPDAEFDEDPIKGDLVFDEDGDPEMEGRYFDDPSDPRPNILKAMDA